MNRLLQMSRQRMEFIVLEVCLKAYSEIGRDVSADEGRLRGAYLIIVVQAF